MADNRIDSRPRDPGCIFCKIVAGEIPCHKVYEDEAVFGFLDIGPLTPGHCLLIPKGHFQNIFDVPPDVIAELSSHLPGLCGPWWRPRGAGLPRSAQ